MSNRMKKFTGRISITLATATLLACNAAPGSSPPQAETALQIEAPAGAGCYRSDSSRDRTLRSHLLALQEGNKTPEETVEAIKQSIVDAGVPFNQVPAAESAAAYALSGGDLTAWEKAYNDFAEPGETDRTTFLNSLCWV